MKMRFYFRFKDSPEDPHKVSYYWIDLPRLDADGNLRPMQDMVREVREIVRKDSGIKPQYIFSRVQTDNYKLNCKMRDAHSWALHAKKICGNEKPEFVSKIVISQFKDGSIKVAFEKSGTGILQNCDILAVQGCRILSASLQQRRKVDHE